MFRLALVMLAVTLSFAELLAQSVARQWDEELLAAIRKDFPAPTVHARNLFHTSVAMYDAWAAYDCRAVGYLHNEDATAVDVAAARNEAVSYAAYRVLTARYALAVDPTNTLAAFHARMAALGYDTNVTTTAGPSPAAVGNRCAAAVLAYGATDGANEAGRYADTTGYEPVNEPLILASNGTGPLNDPNRWQPLAFEFRITQNGLVASNIQGFVSPHWGYVTPFALSGAWSHGVYADFDPGPPPQLGSATDAAFKATFLTNIYFSSLLDPSNGVMIDISPASHGNIPLGTYEERGYETNPVTSLPYVSNIVKQADYARVIAEFWADGPQSETPPGHWNVLANQIHDHPLFQRRFRGTGPILDELEWDVKLYLALNGALHDAAVVAWGIKPYYDFVRPITAIRHMGGLGQSSNPGFLAYHTNGLPLVPGLVEVVTRTSSAPGQRHEHLKAYFGKIAIHTWPGEPADKATQASGAEWILAESWLPYQRHTFVTPAFAGYISGHSTFSRAAAEVLTAFTGDAYFPGGLGTYTVPRGGLEFEYGPTEDIELQWARYYDASDEAGISRLYGGIHPPADDLPGRVMGSRVGMAAFARALPYFDGSILGGDVCSNEKAVQSLITLVDGSDLQHKQPLLATLQAALGSIGRSNSVAAANQLRALQNKVQAQVAPSDPELAMGLILETGRIIDRLGGHAGRWAAEFRLVERRPNGRIHLTFGGKPDRFFAVQASTDLRDWQAIGVVCANPDGNCDLEDAEAPAFSRRFYRIVGP